MRNTAFVFSNISSVILNNLVLPDCPMNGRKNNENNCRILVNSSALGTVFALSLSLSLSLSLALPYSRFNYLISTYSLFSKSAGYPPRVDIPAFLFVNGFDSPFVPGG
jgi:hypothetical protein